VYVLMHGNARPQTLHYETADDTQAEATPAELPDLLASGALTAETRVWFDGLGDWVCRGAACLATLGFIRSYLLANLHVR
jgi:hypothetical protein